MHILVAVTTRPCCDEAAKISGVSKVFLADAAQFADGLAEPIAAQMVSMARLHALVRCCHGYGKNILPRVAASSTRRRFPTSAASNRRYLHTPDLRRERHRDGAVERSDKGRQTARPTT